GCSATLRSLPDDRDPPDQAEPRHPFSSRQTRIPPSLVESFVSADPLDRDPSTVRRKRYAIRLMLSPERKLSNRRAARGHGKDIWPAAQKRVLEDQGPQFLDAYGPECDKSLKPLIDAAGPPRTLNAIQVMRSNLGITETIDARKRRLRKAAANIDYAKRRQIPSTMTWEDLSVIARSIFIASILGDGGVYYANGVHYYAETHKLAHRAYLLWKRELVPDVFHGNFREDIPQHKDPQCVWETGVSEIFTMLRGHFYLDVKRGDKTVISEWIIHQIDLFVLLIWLFDDGRNARKKNGRHPNLEIAVPIWNRQHLESVCETVNRKYNIHLYIRPGAFSNIVVPAKDRDYLLPIWRQYATEYHLPECMLYKIPAHNPPAHMGRLRWEEKFGKDFRGLETIVLRPERVALAETAREMWESGTSLNRIGEFLKAKNHRLTPRYLFGVWERLSLPITRSARSPTT
ncbi:MAG: hypothetical protein ACHQF3_10590, partial [Alphaproteobacteria bacterium]